MGVVSLLMILIVSRMGRLGLAPDGLNSLVISGVLAPLTVTTAQAALLAGVGSFWGKKPVI